jgi:hypothetical protein
LEPALDRLPGGEELNSPATIELNGNVVIRAKNNEQADIIELLLNRSSYSGSPIRINTNRSFLRRALQLGFHEIGFASVESPIICRIQHATYGWQPLSGDSAIEPAAEVQRIESSPQSCPPKQDAILPADPRRSVREPASGHGHGHAQTPEPESNGQAGNDSPGSNLTSLIHEAEALNASLMEARSSFARLLAGLRRHLRPSRILSDTLKSLRQLKLTDVPE